MLRCDCGHTVRACRLWCKLVLGARARAGTSSPHQGQHAGPRAAGSILSQTKPPSFSHNTQCVATKQ